MLDHSADRIINYGVCTDASQEDIDDNHDSVYITTYNGLSSEHVHAFGIFIVADGIGGKLGGRASDVASRIFTNLILEQLMLPTMALDHTERRNQSVEHIRQTLTNTVNATNQYILTHLHEGIGTTFTAVIMLDTLTFYVHIGQSRIYIVSPEPDTIQQLTEDNSQALGLKKEIHVQIEQVELEEDMQIVICNDDIWSTVIDEEILVNSLEYEPQFACNALEEISKDRNPKNQISAIIIHPIIL